LIVEQLILSGSLSRWNHRRCNANLRATRGGLSWGRKRIKEGSKSRDISHSSIYAGFGGALTDVFFLGSASFQADWARALSGMSEPKTTGVLTAGGAIMLQRSVLTQARGISLDGNTIVGTGFRNGNTEAFVAVVPEPTTLGVLVAGGVAMLRRRRV